MNTMQTTYDFEGDHVTASIGGKIVASGSIEEVEAILAEVNVAPEDKTSAVKAATHVVSPNGLKGEIVGRTSSTYGEVLTVRYENGQFRQVDVTDRTNLVTENTRTASSPLGRLSSTLAEKPAYDQPSLRARLRDLAGVRVAAHDLIAQGVGEADLAKLHNITIEASHEQQEIKAALDKMADDEGQAWEPHKLAPEVIPSESLGHKNEVNWLDDVLNESASDAAEVDFEQELDDGPTLLVADQETDLLSDTGATREMALAHVNSKTAGLVGDNVEKFVNLFVARVEEARRIELAHRRHETKKEAATHKSNVDDAPVESLFI